MYLNLLTSFHASVLWITCWKHSATERPLQDGWWLKSHTSSCAKFSQYFKKKLTNFQYYYYFFFIIICSDKHFYDSHDTQPATGLPSIHPGTLCNWREAEPDSGWMVPGFSQSELKKFWLLSIPSLIIYVKESYILLMLYSCIWKCFFFLFFLRNQIISDHQAALNLQQDFLHLRQHLW